MAFQINRYSTETICWVPCWYIVTRTVSICVFLASFLFQKIIIKKTLPYDSCYWFCRKSLKLQYFSKILFLSYVPCVFFLLLILKPKCCSRSSICIRSWKYIWQQFSFPFQLHVALGSSNQIIACLKNQNFIKGIYWNILLIMYLQHHLHLVIIIQFLITSSH